ncbi:RagB/SusD family nutrient uptake outer membrane protein [Rapidithrix thailandica]|uniref:RagB/SusD family nutrient uptake outer membrane protein n=1 Tax=Rapidithrix thailandica TaxID=413964 RepID=A0AAW9S9U5_9BACT
MYKYFTFFFLICAPWMFSCESQLDLYPRSAVSSSADLTENDIESLLIGVYNSVQNKPGRESYITFDLIGGDLINASAVGGGGTNAFISNILRPEYGIIKNSWIGYFKALYQVNTLITALPSMPESARKNQILGTAHYFRAYLYYQLVTRWGAVPILKENTQETLPRDSEESVWAFIEEELSLAIELAPSFGSDLKGDFYFVSSEAASALMARAKLSQGKKDEAATYAESVITSSLFQLDDFGKIFRKQQNSEVIFAFENLTMESSINLSTLFYTYAHPLNGSYVYKPNTGAMNMYSSGDLRTSISIDTYEGLDVVNKYPSGQSGTDPLVITRLAELYLISAEGQGLSGIDRLNELRNARGLGSVSASSEQQYLDLILEERRRELFAEGFRWYDLVRTGKAQEEIGLADRELLLPIPETELLLNEKLEQNPGY